MHKTTHTVHTTTHTHSAQDYTHTVHKTTHTQCTRLHTQCTRLHTQCTRLHTQCTRLHTGSLGPQPQHPVLNTICNKKKSTKKFLLYDQPMRAAYLIVLDMIFQVKLVKSRNYKALSYVHSCTAVLLLTQLCYCLHNRLTLYTTVLLFTQLCYCLHKCYCLHNCVTLYITVLIFI